MKRIDTIGVCLIAACALSALSAESASAMLPEVGRCEASAIGKYKNSNCTAKATAKEKTKTEKWEWHKGAKSETEGVNFTEAGGEATIETKSGTRITCTSYSAIGKYDEDSGAIKEVEAIVMSFRGCGIPAVGIICNTKGHPTGEIVSFPVKGAFGYISGEKTPTPVLGLELTPEKAKGWFFEFECLEGSIIWKVRGDLTKEGEHAGGNCLIAPIESPNEMTTQFKEIYKGSGGVQEPQHFEKATSKFCNLESNTNGGAFERMTWFLTTAITNEEELEILAGI